MEPATIQLVKEVLTDAIKILGPATIAAFATYKVAKTQFTQKLKEIEKNQEFKVREHLFNYYKERQNILSQNYEKLNTTLGEILGFASGYTKDMEDEENFVVKLHTELIEFYSKIIPTEINASLKDMTSQGLNQTSEYQKLKSFEKKMDDMDKENNLKALKSNIFLILEIQHFLQQCNQLLIQKQIDEIFHDSVD